uniref:(California timema) hypothetical protein n=1 Tax=Timema californicum TaxID=61474 RepID=A0A7R9IY62_TIMCA|nr:unnamed protein product [Timema californicum]
MKAKSRPRLVGASLSVLLGAVKHYPVETSRHEISNLVGGTEAKVTGRCLETADPWSPCFCHLELCIGQFYGQKVRDYVTLSGGTEAKVTGGCLETANHWSHCFCHLELCIGQFHRQKLRDYVILKVDRITGWYPCGLKYCKGKGEGKSSSATGSYRCGIKTCKKCSLFSYYVRQKQLCLWDE